MATSDRLKARASATLARLQAPEVWLETKASKMVSAVRTKRARCSNGLWAGRSATVSIVRGFT
jgi:hypothetical protein